MSDPDRKKGAFIEPGAMLGVIGGGQLGRMFVHAAQRTGYGVAVLDPDALSPAGQAAQRHIAAPYLDAAALALFADACRAITTEFENVPAAALERLASTTTVAPAASSVAVCQDRLAEKACFVQHRIACVPHAAIETEEQLADVDTALFPGILKTARLGYDGKGQVAVDDRSALAAAWGWLGDAACVLERKLALRAEISVVLARGHDGAVVHLPVQLNVHRDGVLAVTRVPASGIDAAIQQEALASATRLAHALAHVGVLCVEFFVLADGSLVANEMAPRPHNSGHHSIDSCDVSQFDLQVRAMTNAPLTMPRLHSPCVMLNLLGDLWFAVASDRAREPDWAGVLALPGAHLHLYGKAEARRGRKMGHLTITAPTQGDATSVARRAADVLGLADA